MAKKKVVYLFGAGATHAEVINSNKYFDANFLDKYGLLIRDVSKRVMRNLKDDKWFKEKKEIYAYPAESVNIELLISLLAKNMIPYENIEKLKSLVELDIQSVITDYRKRQFYLHKALFELHQEIRWKEKLLGIISLNYDDVVDTAYRSVINKEPWYCLSGSDSASNKIPLLKLHGSFSWKNVPLFGRRRDIPIIPLGAEKNYLTPPYSLIWSMALELLTKTDVLRIIGCSLNANDLGLIDLLFKAHNEKDGKIQMEIIDFQQAGEDHHIIKQYGFLAGFVNPLDIEERLIPHNEISDYKTGNPFKAWLKAKARSELSSKVLANTRHLIKLED